MFCFSINKKGKIELNLHECDNIILQSSYHYKLLQNRFVILKLKPSFNLFRVQTTQVNTYLADATLSGGASNVDIPVFKL
jgi:hypothetical protein